MTDSAESKPTLVELTLRAVDGTLSESEARELVRLLKESPEAQSQYVEVIQMCAGGIQQVLATAPAAAAPRPLPLRRRLQLHRFKAAAIVLLPLGIAGGLWMLFRTPVAEWRNGAYAQFEPALQMNGAVPSRQISITEGVAEINLNNGTSLIFQAPARFQIESGTLVHLYEGQLAATVPHQVRRFTVQTSNASVTDLGTEFGVAASDRSTDVDVFTGKVQVRRVGGPAAAVDPDTATLSAGESLHVDGQTFAVDPRGARPHRFARTTSVEKLDLTDILSGGDGSSRRRNIAIDPMTGAVGHLPPSDTYQTDHRYHSVTGLSTIAGCFVPDGGSGPVVVDPEGHTFAFPPTSGRSFGQIWTGGSVPIPPSAIKIRTTHNGVDYAGTSHSLIFMGGNKGLTIDLARIREAHHGRILLRFETGIWRTSPTGIRRMPADVYVLIDGQPRFIDRNLTDRDAVAQVSVPITNKDHFLTLATTTPAENVGSSGILWNDAKLEMLSE